MFGCQDLHRERVVSRDSLFQERGEPMIPRKSGTWVRAAFQFQLSAGLLALMLVSYCARPSYGQGGTCLFRCFPGSCAKTFDGKCWTITQGLFCRWGYVSKLGCLLDSECFCGGYANVQWRETANCTLECNPNQVEAGYAYDCGAPFGPAFDRVCCSACIFKTPPEGGN